MTEIASQTGAAVQRFVSSHPYALIVGALVLGMYLGQSGVLGYSNAEECAVKAQTRWSAGACYDLYPSIHDKK